MSSTGIRLAVLDMAGTTVRDDGAVEAAFLDALTEVGIPWDHPEVAGHLAYVRQTMGMSKIVVFRNLLHDDVRAEAANRAFEQAFARRVDAGEVAPVDGAEAAFDALREQGILVCLTTGFADATRAAII